MFACKHSYMCEKWSIFSILQRSYENICFSFLYSSVASKTTYNYLNQKKNIVRNKKKQNVYLLVKILYVKNKYSHKELNNNIKGCPVHLNELFYQNKRS